MVIQSQGAQQGQPPFFLCPVRNSQIGDLVTSPKAVVPLSKSLKLSYIVSYQWSWARRHPGLVHVMARGLVDAIPLMLRAFLGLLEEVSFTRIMYLPICVSITYVFAIQAVQLEHMFASESIFSLFASRRRIKAYVWGGILSILKSLR